MVSEVRNLAKNTFRLYAICFTTFILQALLCLFNYNSIISDIISIGSFTVLFYSIFVYQPEILSKYLLYFVMSTWAVLALLLLENGNVYLRGNRSMHFGSLPTYVFGWMVFYTVIILSESRMKRRAIYNCDRLRNENNTRKPSESEIRTVIFISCIATIVLATCFISIIDKPYFSLSIDRFAYAQNVLPTYISALQIWFYAFVPVTLMLKDTKKWIPIIYVSLLCLLSIWVGEKFTGLFITIYFVMIAMNPAYVSKVMIKKMRKLITRVLIIIAGLIIVVFLNQLALYNSDLYEFTNYLEDRVAAQGELWWLTYGDDQAGGTHFDEISDETDVLISQPKGIMANYNFGIYKLMNRFMNLNWVTSSLSQGIRATESTRATFYYYGKVLGLLFGQILLAVLISRFVNLCIKMCDQKRWLMALVTMYIFKSIITASLMSDFQLLTTNRSIVMYLILTLFSNRRIKMHA